MYVCMYVHIHAYIHTYIHVCIVNSFIICLFAYNLESAHSTIEVVYRLYNYNNNPLCPLCEQEYNIYHMLVITLLATYIHTDFPNSSIIRVIIK